MDQPAQLSLGQFTGGVIEDEALLADVEIVVFIMRNPGLIRGGDIHYRHAVARLIGSGVAFGHGNTGGKCGHHRLPDQPAHQPVRQCLTP